MLGVGGGLLLEQGLKSKQTIDLISEKAVRIDSSCPLDSLFASDEEDEGQDVRLVVPLTHALYMYMHVYMCMYSIHIVVVVPDTIL